jgi:hypothetical protein
VFLRYLWTLYPPGVRLGLVLDNYSPHLSTCDDPRVGQWAAANHVELAYVPTNASWLNRIEAQFTAPRYFAVDGTDHPSHAEQASRIRRYIAWRNRNARDRRLGEIINRANVGGIVKSCGSPVPHDHAATSLVSSSGASLDRSTSLPFSNLAPARTSATRCGPLTARHRCSGASSRLNTIASPACLLPGPLVTRVVARTGEKVDSRRIRRR